MDRTCLIAGPGYTGLRLATRLLGSRRVIALARSDAAATEAAHLHCEVIRLDLDAPEPGTAIATAADGAAIAYLIPPPDRGTTDPRLGRFLELLGEARPAVLLYLSTTGVYGDAGGRIVTESSPVAPLTDRGRRRADAEQVAMHWCEARGARCVVLRVPGIYGPGRLPLDRLRRGEPAIRPEDAGPGNRIHVDDLVEACIAGLERPVEGFFNVCDGDHASATAFLQRTAALAGLPPPPLVTLAAAREQLSPGMLSFLLESRRVDNARMRGTLGVEPRYACIDDGIAASLAETRAARD